MPRLLFTRADAGAVGRVAPGTGGAGRADRLPWWMGPKRGRWAAERREMDYRRVRASLALFAALAAVWWALALLQAGSEGPTRPELAAERRGSWGPPAGRR